MKLLKLLCAAAAIYLALTVNALCAGPELRFGPWAYYASYYFPPFVYDQCFMPADAWLPKYETPPPPMPNWDPGKSPLGPTKLQKKKVKRASRGYLKAPMQPQPKQLKEKRRLGPPPGRTRPIPDRVEAVQPRSVVSSY